MKKFRNWLRSDMAENITIIFSILFILNMIRVIFKL